jgi:long-chain acyl-CoA synthetase
VPALRRTSARTSRKACAKRAHGPSVSQRPSACTRTTPRLEPRAGRHILKKPLLAVYDALIFRKIRANFGGRLQFIIGGGALLDIELQRFFYAIGIPMLQGYGLTEAAPVISANTLGRHKLGSSGRIMPDLEVRICDAQGHALPPGARGEIVVRGENVMAGYWKNETATAEVLRDGWLYTGDIGYLDEDGFLYVLGRVKSLLIADDGEKYSPEQIEEAATGNRRTSSS